MLFDFCYIKDYIDLTVFKGNNKMLFGYRTPSMGQKEFESVLGWFYDLFFFQSAQIPVVLVGTPGCVRAFWGIINWWCTCDISLHSHSVPPDWHNYAHFIDTISLLFSPGIIVLVTLRFDLFLLGSGLFSSRWLPVAGSLATEYKLYFI